MSGAITHKTFSGAPTGTPYEGELATREDSPNGDIYVGRNGVWVNLRTGGVVIGTGDWTGSSDNNKVEALSGLAGHVSVKCAELTWIEGISTFGLNQANPTSPTNRAADFVLQLATPHAAAAGAFRNAPIGAFNIPAPTSGGDPGYWIFRVNNNDIVSVRDQSFRSHVDTIEWDENVSAPFLGIAPRSTDAPTRPLRIRSQDAYLLASSNVTSGDIWYEVGPSVGDPPDPGKHRWFVGNVERATLGKDALTLRLPLSYAAATTSILDIAPEQVADGVGHGIRVTGGAANGAGNNKGGDVVFFGGAPANSGRYGSIILANNLGQGMVSVADAGSDRFVVALCATAAPANIPFDEANYIYVGDMTGFPTGAPTSGCVIGSFGGNFVWKNASGASFLYDGSFDSSSGGAADFVIVWFNGIQRKLQTYFM